MTLKKIAPFLLLLVLLLLALWLRNTPDTSKTTRTAPKPNSRTKGLNRNPSKINLSKHAKCRMACRHIDMAEIKELLRNGRINYNKSDLKGTDCNKKYAVEATSKDKQHLRVIFAPCADELTVVTCIDLDTEWTCDCP